MKKNRARRRAKHQYEELRQEADKLEGDLDVLRQLRMQRSEYARQVNEGKAKQGSAFTSPTQHFVWRKIAERQFKERWRAQSRNRELRSQLEAEFKLGRQLQTLLRHVLVPSQKIAEVVKRQPVKVKSVFEQEIVDAEGVLLEIEGALRGAAFTDPNDYFTTAYKENGTNAFVIQSNVTLPFGVQVVGNALWSVLGNHRLKDLCYDHYVVFMTDDMLTQTFGIRSSINGKETDFRVKYTLCRFKDATRTVIVWVAYFEPIELDGVRYCNIQANQRGWIQLNNHTAGNTLVRSHSRLTVEGGGVEKESQITSLLDILKPMHDQVSVVVASLLEDVLFEEDWKLNGFGG
ncbi:hypothetical protein PHYBOEH_006784 [Phytophthora boehmeriae]|uniref:M96 mating-specific protein family n=1 Tax=Phytophthora boehmeriae TaxID=109152 RepID=A0A8T1WBY9_9STRA|nr:hypothetical protein PHYBOEH_006784 [Phytophthora boehmeriae]